VRLDHLLSKEQHWPHTIPGSFLGGWGPDRLMPQADVLWVGLLISGALAIRFFLVDPRCEYCPSVSVGSGKPSWGWAGEGRAHCWVLRKRAPDGFHLVLVVFRSPLSLSRRVGGVGSGVRAGLAAIPRLFSSVFGFRWFGGGVGWCPFVF
jgi:hypothetical protein